MKARQVLWIGGLVALLALAACGPRQPEGGPTRSVIAGERSVRYSFQQPQTTWDTFVAPGQQALFRLGQGALEGAVTPRRGYVWSLNNEPHRDVIVSARVRQTEGRLGNGFGLICRADEQGNGYYFLISSDQYFSISVGTSARNDLFQLVPWQYHSAIRRGRVTNELRAVCAGDYLALFINDVFVAETTDREFESGMLGVTLAAVEQTAWVRFSDIWLRDARLLGSR